MNTHHTPLLGTDVQIFVIRDVWSEGHAGIRIEYWWEFQQHPRNVNYFLRYQDIYDHTAYGFPSSFALLRTHVRQGLREIEKHILYYQWREQNRHLLGEL